jgi:hypothetical protein
MMKVISGYSGGRTVNAITLRNSAKSFINMRFNIDQSQVFRLSNIERLLVEKGVVWITQHGQDIVLRTGDVLSGEDFSPDALLSVVGADCAILDVIFPRDSAASLPLDSLFALSKSSL